MPSLVGESSAHDVRQLADTPGDDAAGIGLVVRGSENVSPVKGCVRDRVARLQVGNVDCPWWRTVQRSVRYFTPSGLTRIASVHDECSGLQSQYDPAT